MLGRSTASPVQDLLRNTPQLLALPRAVHKERLHSKLRICQRCYHHNLRAPYSERGIIVAQRDDRHKIRSHRIAISKSYSRALSIGNTNAGDKPRSDLPSQEEGRRSHISKSFSHVMDNLQSNIFIAGQRLNDLTGYSGIEALKKDIEQQGRLSTHFQEAPTLTRARDSCPDFSNDLTDGKRGVHPSYKPALQLPARSKRTPAAKARLDAQRPGALHGALPLGPRERASRSCRPGESADSGAAGGGGGS